MCGASLAAIKIAASDEGDALRGGLQDNAGRFRAGLERAGFDLISGVHPIVPIMLGEARLAQQMAARLLDEGVYVTGFSFPVVPHGKARIRTQLSAAHTPDQIDRTIDAFARVGRSLGVIA